MVAVFQFSGLITGMSSTSVAAAAAAPSCWEFGAFIGYIQSVAAIGHITARDIPAFLLTYGDTFSWTVFIPFHSDKSAIGRRRLSVVVLDGLIAFADRIGVKETDLLNRCVAGFLILVGILAVVLAIVVIYNKVRKDRLDPANDPFSLAPQREQTDARNRLFVVAGVGVLLWLFALYPLSLMATFEIAEEIRAKEISSGPLTIAIVMLMLVVLGIFAVSVVVVYKLRTDQDMLRPKNRLVWGSLYMDVVYDRRLFFVVPVAVQILSGVVVGGFQGQTSQLVCLLALDIVLLLGIFVLRPFVKGSLAQWLAGISAFVRVLNTALAFAFISDSVDTKKSSSTRQVANALIAINTVVIIAWFLRHFGVLCRITRDRMQCMNDKKNEVGTPSTAGETTSSNQYARALLDQNQNSGGQV
ncbi:hypothetical protein PINS_up001095 [Pythium insidiosum]|nr:hypothetical protein PINS_up001095 [Pythium insidiosum]